MKTQLNRRRFLALCGAVVPAIWMPGCGLVKLPGNMVLSMMGKCSFCQKNAKELFGVAGVIGRKERICNECVVLCLDILSEQYSGEVKYHPPDPIDNQEIEATAQLLEEIHERIAKGEDADSLIKAIARYSDTEFDDGVTEPFTLQDFACCFCSANRSQVEFLISGPNIFICETCTGDAAALFTKHGDRDCLLRRT